MNTIFNILTGKSSKIPLYSIKQNDNFSHKFTKSIYNNTIDTGGENMYPEFPYLGYKDEMVRTPITFPAQHQDSQPGLEGLMNPLPIFDNPSYTRKW